MADESVVLDVLIELKQEGLEMIRVMSGQLSELNDKVRDVNQSLERMSDRLHADALAFLELAGAATVARGATGGGGVMGFVGSLAALMPGGTVAGYAILGVLGIAAALAPLSYAFLAATANAIAWTAISTVAISAIGGLAAALFMLGAANAGGLSPATEMVKAHHALAAAIKEHNKALDELASSKAGVDVYGTGSRSQNIGIASAYVTATSRNLADAQHDIHEPMSGLGGPIDRLGSAIDDMRHHFETVSRPIADSIAAWMLPLLNGIETAGDSIVKWFGQRLPQIFEVATATVRNLSGFFGSIFGTISKVVDYFLAHRAEVDAFWKSFLTVGAAAFDGFMNVMMNIADWFHQHWPAISKAAGDAWALLKSGWDAVAPLLKEGLKELGRLLKDVVDHFGDLKPLLPIVGGLLAGFLLGIEGALGGLILMVGLLERAVAAAAWIQKNGLPFGISGGTGGVLKTYRTDPNALQLSTPANSQMTGSPGEHGRSGLNVLPMAFVTMPPSREQVSIMREAIRRLDRAQT